MLNIKEQKVVKIMYSLSLLLSLSLSLSLSVFLSLAIALLLYMKMGTTGEVFHKSLKW